MFLCHLIILMVQKLSVLLIWCENILFGDNVKHFTNNITNRSSPMINFITYKNDYSIIYRKS